MLPYCSCFSILPQISLDQTALGHYSSMVARLPKSQRRWDKGRGAILLAGIPLGTLGRFLPQKNYPPHSIHQPIGDSCGGEKGLFQGRVLTWLPGHSPVGGLSGSQCSPSLPFPCLEEQRAEDHGTVGVLNSEEKLTAIQVGNSSFLQEILSMVVYTRAM